MDGVKGKLEKEKATSVALKSELETTAMKVQTITVDGVLISRVELMEEYKRGKHSSWDLNEEIQTWEKRAAVLAGGDVSEDEEKSAPAVRIPKEVVLGGGSNQAEPDMGAKDAAADIGEQAASHEDITRD